MNHVHPIHPLQRAMHGGHSHHHHATPAPSLNRTAFQATLHCLTGCAIGEVLGLVIGTTLGLGNGVTIALSVALAFAFGFALTAWPFVRQGQPLRTALGIAFAADTASIALMEFVDNGFMLAVPGAMDAGLGDTLFWGSMAASLAIAGIAAFPLNRWMIARGLGHAVAHRHHH